MNITARDPRDVEDAVPYGTTTRVIPSGAYPPPLSFRAVVEESWAEMMYKTARP